MAQKRNGMLVPRLILICLGGWAMASFASIEAPAAIKLVTIETQLGDVDERSKKNSEEIAEIKKQIYKNIQ